MTPPRIVVHRAITDTIPIRERPGLNLVVHCDPDGVPVTVEFEGDGMITAEDVERAGLIVAHRRTEFEAAARGCCAKCGYYQNRQPDGLNLYTCPACYPPSPALIGGAL